MYGLKQSVVIAHKELKMFWNHMDKDQSRSLRTYVNMTPNQLCPRW